MIGLRLRDAQRGFFDRATVVAATSAAERRVLSRFGAFVRQRARSSIRSRIAPSPPGSPPSSHVGLLRRQIFFAYDAGRRSVVVGPVRLNQGRGEAPALLEFGGPAVRMQHGHARRVTYRARPYMRPAFEVELRALPPRWRNSIR